MNKEILNQFFPLLLWQLALLSFVAGFYAFELAEHVKPKSIMLQIILDVIYVVRNVFAEIFAENFDSSAKLEAVLNIIITLFSYLSLFYCCHTISLYLLFYKFFGFLRKVGVMFGISYLQPTILKYHLLFLPEKLNTAPKSKSITQ